MSVSVSVRKTARVSRDLNRTWVRTCNRTTAPLAMCRSLSILPARASPRPLADQPFHGLMDMADPFRKILTVESSVSRSLALPPCLCRHVFGNKKSLTVFEIHMTWMRLSMKEQISDREKQGFFDNILLYISCRPCRDICNSGNSLTDFGLS